MEPITKYLLDTRKRLENELSELFEKLESEKNVKAYDSIVDLYDVLLKGDNSSIEPVITYSPCLQLEYINALYDNTRLTWIISFNYKLPEDEKIVYIKTYNSSKNTPQGIEHTTYCVVVTNYSRVLTSLNTEIKKLSQYGAPATHITCYKIYNDIELHYAKSEGIGFVWNYDKLYDSTRDPTYYQMEPIKIITLDPLSYKLPKWCFEGFHAINDANEEKLQSLSKDIFMFIGRWKENITATATLDVELMLSTTETQKNNVKNLEQRVKELETKVGIQETTIETMSQRINVLEEENEDIEVYEPYFDAVVAFMEKETYNKNWADENGVEDFIKYMEDMECINKSTYKTLVEAEKEAKEYRIYQKVKGNIVTSGVNKSRMSKKILEED